MSGCGCVSLMYFNESHDNDDHEQLKRGRGRGDVKWL